jgi:general secretion pathway protein C
MLHNISSPSPLPSTRSANASRWLAALSTLVVWAAAAAVVAYWVLQFAGVSGRASQAPTVSRAMSAEPALANVQKALGATSGPAVVATADASARFALSGVVALSSGQGAALIAVDGQSPKAFKVGQTVAEGLVLQSLGPRQARVGASLNGPALFALDMPALAPPATGSSVIATPNAKAIESTKP